MYHLCAVFRGYDEESSYILRGLRLLCKLPAPLWQFTLFTLNTMLRNHSKTDVYGTYFSRRIALLLWYLTVQRLQC